MTADGAPFDSDVKGEPVRNLKTFVKCENVADGAKVRVTSTMPKIIPEGSGSVARTGQMSLYARI